MVPYVYVTSHGMGNCPDKNLSNVCLVLHSKKQVTEW